MPFTFQPGEYTTPKIPGDRVRTGNRATLNATILHRRDLNPGLTVLTVGLDRWTLDPFEPGQYADIGLQVRPHDRETVPLTSVPGTFHELLRRSYSIASSPAQLDRLEFLINLVPEGEMTPGIWRLNEGDRLYVDPRIRGRFTLQHVPEGSDIVLVATGTGIAPFMAMVRRYAGTGRWRRLVLIHSVRYAEDLAYRDELHRLAALDPGLTYLPTVTREPEANGWQGLQGRVHALMEVDRFTELAGFTPDPDRTHIYLCGNPQMIDSMRRTLEQRGHTRQTANRPGTLHIESYW